MFSQGLPQGPWLKPTITEPVDPAHPTMRAHCHGCAQCHG
jgi:hypothetical protein